MQRDWVGRSEGAHIRFALPDHGGEEVEVFTTRADTLFGATYMVLAPEHPLVPKVTTEEQRSAVDAYIEAVSGRSERARLADVSEKTGVFTGATAEHPVTGARLPIWIADYVLASYGTGAVMAVPAHDNRDYDFARSFELPIVEVVAGGDIAQAAFVDDGVCVHSDFLDGLSTPDAKRAMAEWLEEQGKGGPTVTYKLRDWLFSRQRYWGEPFPVIHLENGETALLPDSELPVLLPELDDFRPSGEFEPPLARVRDWVETTDPQTGAPALRDTNTMPQWAGSCWYYLRFCDPHNSEAPWSAEAEKYWMPVDLYVGGAEHAVLHLLYSRFWHKVLYDLDLVHTKEPFRKLLNQGMVLGYSYRYYDDNISDAEGIAPNTFSASEVRMEGEATVAVATGAPLKTRWVLGEEVRFDADGTPWHPSIDGLLLEEVTEKMSKSRGNVINPDDVIARYGTDSMRLYEMFMGPLDKSAPWSDESIPGVYRFLQRAYRLIVEDSVAGESPAQLADGEGTDKQQRLLAKTVQGVTEDIEALRFNTAISKLMVFARDIGREAPLPRRAVEQFVLMLSPFAPHLAEELWERLGNSPSLASENWPQADPALLEEAVVVLAVQVNGKRRDEIEVPADADEETIRQQALASPSVKRHLAEREPKRVIVVPGRLVNIVG
jgi:leucyl-tRNA synthetase